MTTRSTLAHQIRAAYDLLGIDRRTIALTRGMMLLGALMVASESRAVAEEAFNYIVNAGGFESFADGNLVGQQGWLTSPPSEPGNVTTATVMPAAGPDGSKAVRVSRGANEDRRFAVVVQEGVDYDLGRFVLASWDMRVNQSNGSASQFGPLMGVEAYDNNAPSPPFTLIGSLGVDATTGDVIYQATNTGFIKETGVFATFGAWHHFDLLLDFNTKTYRGYFDSQELFQEGFVDGGITALTDVDLSAIAAATNSMAVTADAYVDNFQVFNGVPGDLDEDGKVTGSDLAVWAANLGPNPGGDINGDGDSDGNDFLTWQRLFGFDLIASTAVATTIPEPTSAMLALALGTALAARRRQA
jgi:hypothetical protein